MSARSWVLVVLLLSGSAAGADLRGDLEKRVALEVDAARRMADAEERYRRGAALVREGRRDEAGGEFRAAEAIILDAAEETYFETALRAYLHELRSRLAEHTPSAPAAPALAALQDIPLDPRALAWLASAVKRPIPEEAELRSIFRSRGVPEPLIYVGLVESGFRTGAISAAGAVGPWQFMPETARRYGLRLLGVDERRDLLKAARAAAEYLRDLHALLGDWTLAVAAYNAGEYRVLRAVHKAASRDFRQLRHLLPAETAEYVPRVMAAIRLARATGGTL